MSFPFFHQLNSQNCGIACIRMICKYYNINLSNYEIERHCHITDKGISILCMEHALKSFSVSTNTYKFKIENFSNASNPCIILTKESHYCILYKIKNNTYYIADPKIGLLKIDKTTFITKYSYINTDIHNSEFIVIIPTYNNSGATSNNNKKNIHNKHSFKKFFLKTANDFRLHLSFTLLLLLLGFALQSTLPFLTKNIIDKAIIPHNLNILILILIGQLFIVIGRTSSYILRNWLTTKVSLSLTMKLILNFISKVLELPLSFFDIKRLGDLLQRINDYSRIQSFINGPFIESLTSLAIILIYTTILLFFNFNIFLSALIFLCSIILWNYLFTHKRKLLDNLLFDIQSKDSSITYELFTNAPDLKINLCSETYMKKWCDIQQRFMNIKLKILRLKQFQQGGNSTLNELMNITITFITALYVMDGTMSIGSMLSIQFICGQLYAPINSVSTFISSIQETNLSIERIKDIHTRDSENINRPIKHLEDKNFDIIISNLSFTYNSNLSETLSNLSIYIPHGKITAIVGHSGSGKTTLVKLLLQFYTNYTGTIKINNTELRDIDISKLRAITGIVRQESDIFSDSILNNITCNEKNPDIKRIEIAAKLACIQDFIDSLPMKYETHIGNDGIGISCGQKQRILLARLFYKNPEIIILDEATSALDSTTEKEIINNLYSFFKTKTVIIVAHRLATITYADNILVLKNGRIVEQGNHKELLQKRCHYYGLVNNQLINQDKTFSFAY